MPPRLDPARREIAVGTRRLPFRLDLRNDRVSVTLGEAEMAVRPLQWREKVTLARFAHLGPDFLRDEVIRLCTVSELPASLPAEDADVLWELAAWMSEPPTSTPVPLDSRSVAAVTLRLCKAMGLKPADFDSRSAPEVEAMWEALGQSSERDFDESSPASNSATKIVIVPDDEPCHPERSRGIPLERSEPRATAGDPSTARNAGVLAGWPDAVPASVGRRDAAGPAAVTAALHDAVAPSPSPEPASRNAGVPAGWPDAVPASAGRRDAPGPAAFRERSEPRAAAGDPSTPLGMTRIAASRNAGVLAGWPDAVPASAGRRDAAGPAAGTAAFHERGEPRATEGDPSTSLGMTRVAPAIPASRNAGVPAGWPDAVPASANSTQSIGAMAMTAAMSRTRIAHVEDIRAPWGEGAPASEEREQEDIFETLADRLEQAAAEMGIGEG